MLGVAKNAVRALRGDDYARYMLAEKAAERIHPDAIVNDRDLFWQHDQAFRALHDRFQPDHRRRMDRVWLLKEFALRAAALDGDTAECGVYTGLSSYVIASVSRKPHHAFDSFEGLSPPGETDGTYWNAGDLAASLAVVQHNLRHLPNVHYHPGWIPDRFGDVADRSFSLVHIDVDLADPTAACLEFFGARMMPGGVLVLDDYGMETCPGARAVTKEFAMSRGVTVLELPTGQGLILDL